MKVLNVGCGRDSLPSWLGDVEEVRLDLNREFEPHIVADMTDLGEIGSYDVIYCNHSLEHLHPADVKRALSEFHRVLNDNGKVVLFVPDIEDVKPTKEVLYISPAGPVTGHDMIYGYSKYIRTYPYMQHLTGFIKQTLEEALKDAGFSNIQVVRTPMYNLMGVGVK